jgi:hypothetical protein
MFEADHTHKQTYSLLRSLQQTISALRKGEPVLSQDNLSALSVANLAATGWLLVSSTSSPGNLVGFCMTAGGC